MDERQKYNLELIHALDKLIAEGHWEGGIFFQAMGKKLRDLSHQLKEDLGVNELLETEQTSLTTAEIKETIKQHSGLIEVYISLYSLDGRNLKKWEVVLASLPKQFISRPIYKKEKDIKAVIHSKENPINDAYAVAYVQELDLLTPSFRDKKPLDRYGHELLILKETALRQENISKFIHLEQEYVYRKGVLSKI